MSPLDLLFIMMDSDDNDDIEKSNTGSPVHVITAGGAGSGSKRKKKKKRNKKKSPSADTNDDGKAGDSSTLRVGGTGGDTSSATTMTGGNGSSENNDHSHKLHLMTALEIEQSESATDQDDVMAFARAPASSSYHPDGGPSMLSEETTPEGGSMKDIDFDNSNNASKSSIHGQSTSQPPPPPIMSEIVVDDEEATSSKANDVIWLFFCFMGIMASFVCYGLLLEYTTSGGRKLHELSFLFVTSSLYTLTAAAGRYVRAETPTTIPPARFAILGLTSMGSTFCSVRSLRYVHLDAFLFFIAIFFLFYPLPIWLWLMLFLTACISMHHFQLRNLSNSSVGKKLQTCPRHAHGSTYGETICNTEIY